MLRVLLISLALIFSAPVGFAGTADAKSAEALVTQAAERISQSDETEIADAVLDQLDVPLIARFTLGKHAKRLDEGQTSRFMDAMQTYIRRQITANADALTDIQVSVLKTVERNKRDAIVTTRIEGAGDPITLRWRVIERGGRWSVVDLEFAGIWLAIEQRAQVTAILDRPGADIEDVIETFG